MRIRGSLVAVLVAALTAPAVAGADTTIGITAPPSGATTHPCPSSPQQILFEFTGGGLTGPLSVPSSSGPQAISHWATNATGVTTSQQLTLVVLRVMTTPTPSLTVVGTDTETVTPPSSPATAVESFAVAQPIEVQGGDLVAQYAPTTNPDLTCYWSSGAGETAEVEGLPQMSAPTSGEVITPAGSGIFSASSDLNLSATLGPLNYDAAVSLTAGPANAVAGQPAVFTATVTDEGPLPGPITFTDPVPTALTVDYAASSAGSCSTSSVNIVTCSLSTLAAGASTKVAIVVTPKSAQTFSDSAAVSLTGGGTDPNPANNSASTTLTVIKPGAPTECVVPKLGGASLSLASKVLSLLGCKAGKVTRATSKSVPKGDVISTNPRAGTFAVGKTVAITVSSGKPKKKKHKQ